jgi:hypothetical protein
VLVQYSDGGTASKRWLYTDERGSIVAQTDASGSIQAANTYDDDENQYHLGNGAFSSWHSRIDQLGPVPAYRPDGAAGD